LSNRSVPKLRYDAKIARFRPISRVVGTRILHQMSERAAQPRASDGRDGSGRRGNTPGSTAAHAPLVLASGSPRRLELLCEAGFTPEVEAADIDDSSLVLGEVGAAATATSLAYFKARRVASARRGRDAPAAWILAADTVCERDGAILGKPVDESDARAMIRSLAERRHGVVTGWCLLSPEGGVRLGRARAEVDLGALPADDFERFLAEGRWRGKAGGYNLPEVEARGWPVRCEGDPHAVVGLPIAQIAPMLWASLGGRA
jgi:septum formation protein